MSKLGMFQRAINLLMKGGTGKTIRAVGRTAGSAHKTENVLSAFGGMYQKMWDIPFVIGMGIGGSVLRGGFRMGKRVLKGADTILLGTAMQRGNIARTGIGLVKRTDRRLMALSGFVQRNPKKSFAYAAGAAAIYGISSTVSEFHSDYARRAEQLELSKGSTHRIDTSMIPASFNFASKRPMSDMNAGNYTLSAHYGRV